MNPGGEVTDLISFDPDDNGPAVPELIISGFFSEMAGEPARFVARYVDGAWVEFEGGLRRHCPYGCNPEVKLTAVRVNREGRLVPALAVASALIGAGDQPSHGVALWIGACPCAADCDGSGALDFMDFLCFQQRFGAGDLRADCDGDSALTLFDYLCFQNAYAAGCP